MYVLHPTDVIAPCCSRGGYNCTHEQAQVPEMGPWCRSIDTGLTLLYTVYHGFRLASHPTHSQLLGDR